MRTVLAGTGSVLPAKRITNHDLAQTLDTSDEWITSRTGIKARHVCAEGETTSTLAIEAARHALGRAGLTADEIGLVIVATTTPDFTFPAVANLVQGALNIPQAMAFDVQNACNGFVVALQVADSLMKQNSIKHALVIGADTFSHIMDWTDRNTAILFGDGAGAVVLSLEEGEATAKSKLSGIIGGKNFSDGTQAEALKTKGGPGSSGSCGTILMNGREVFKLAVRRMGETIPALMQQFSITPEEVTALVPHQANVRILESIAQSAGVPMDKVVVTLDEHANTSAASIPLALDAAFRRNAFSSGDLLLLLGFGAGFAWGGLFIRV